MSHTDGHVISRNVLWNSLGLGLPLIVAFFSIPWLVAGLGTARFGLFTLVWAIAGYFSLFDFGLGRALTKMVAEKIGAHCPEEVPALLWTGSVLTLLLGTAGGVALGVLSPWLLTNVLQVPVDLQGEAREAFTLVAFVLPLVTSATILRGALEAYQRFGITSFVRALLGVITFAGPLLILPFSQSFTAVVGILALGRILAWACYLWACIRVIPGSGWPGFSVRSAAILARMGGWMTVSNLISPLLTYLDRFLIGGVVSLTAVAYYTIPYEMVTALWVIPVALSGVLFAAMSASLGHDRARAVRLMGQGIRYVFLALFPVILFLITFSAEGLEFWLGPEFARNGSFVLQWIAAGVFVNSLAHAAFAFVQGSGRPDLTAKLHLFELLFYVPLLWWALDRFGVNGAAVVWFARVTVDTVALLVIVVRLAQEACPMIRRVSLHGLVALCAFALAGALQTPWLKSLFFVICGTGFVGLGWHLMLDQHERAGILQRLKGISARFRSIHG